MLRDAGRRYRTSRDREGVYEFLETAYAVYWNIKKNGRVGQSKLLLRQASELPAKPPRVLSDLVLVIASKDRDRRDRHRWKRLIEEAYLRKVGPEYFKQQLHDLHGVNNALIYWKTLPPSKIQGYDPFPAGDLYGRSPALDIPMAVDGEV